MTRVNLRATVNGATVERSVPARTSLADFLRDHLALTGTIWAVSTACAAPVLSSSTAAACGPA